MARTLDIPRRNGGPGKRTEAVAAAGLVSAAAAGGKYAWDRRAKARRKGEQAFRLHEGEAIPEGIQRIARGQLEQTHEALQHDASDDLSEAVHSARKAFKRLRACVRLTRDAIGDDTYRRENGAFRDAGRRLAGARDASVLGATLDDLEQAAGYALPATATARLRGRLEDERKRALNSLARDQVRLAGVIADVEQAQRRTDDWSFETEGFDALAPGLRRIYRRGRKAMQRAEAEPTSENLHEWRKRVKDLWHAEEILRPAKPEKLKELAKRMHALADLLGDDHDLAELHLYVERHRHTFDDRMAHAALVAMIGRRRQELQRRAFQLGPQLYERSPKRFVKAVR